jgi:hypothetical protein
VVRSIGALPGNRASFEPIVMVHLENTSTDISQYRPQELCSFEHHEHRGQRFSQICDVPMCGLWPA